MRIPPSPAMGSISTPATCSGSTWCTSSQSSMKSTYIVSSYGPGPEWNGARKRFGYGAKTNPGTYGALPEVTSARSVPRAAVR